MGRISYVKDDIVWSVVRAKARDICEAVKCECLDGARLLSKQASPISFSARSVLLCCSAASPGRLQLPHRPLSFNSTQGSLSDSMVLLFDAPIPTVDHVEAIVYFLGKIHDHGCCGFFNPCTTGRAELRGTLGELWT